MNYELRIYSSPLFFLPPPSHTLLSLVVLLSSVADLSTEYTSMYKVTNFTKHKDLIVEEKNKKDDFDLVNCVVGKGMKVPKLQYDERVHSEVTITSSGRKTSVDCTRGFATSTGLICRHMSCVIDAVDSSRGVDNSDKSNKIPSFLSTDLIHSLVKPFWHTNDSDYAGLTSKVVTNAAARRKNTLFAPKPKHNNEAMFAYIVNGIAAGKATNGVDPAWLAAELTKLSVTCFGPSNNAFEYVGAPVDTRTKEEKRRTKRLTPSCGPTSTN